MSKQLMPIICLIGILGAPFIAATIKPTAINKNIEHKTVVNKEFTVKVNDINKSSSGFVTCSYYIVELSKVLMGPCSSPDGAKFILGRTYTVTRAVVEKDFINITNAKLIAGMIRRQVVRVGHIGWTRMAWLDNGDVIGGDNVAVGDWINIE